MSKIGKKSIKIPEGFAVQIKDGEIIFKGKNGEAVLRILPYIKAELKDGELNFSLLAQSKRARSNWGTIRSLSQNVVQGLTQGFEKVLVLEGVGYRAVKEGNDLILTLGFSHPVRYTPPKGINFEVEKNSVLTIKGFDKALVGQTAAEIRAFKKPEPYKGKGIHYVNEVIRRKAGKKAVAASGGGAGASAA